MGDSDAQADGHGPGIVSLEGTDIATGSQSDPIPGTKEFPHAGEPVYYVPTEAEDHAQTGKCHPFGPFYDEEIYQWCEYAITHKMTASLIEKLLKTNCEMKEKFKTHLPLRYVFMKKFDEMITNERLGSNVFQKSELHFGGEAHSFWHRDVVECAQWLLRQPCYRDHLFFSPVRSYNSSGSRVYGEMNTGDWWWDKQVRYKTSSQSYILLIGAKAAVEEGDTIVPIILMSDATHLTNFVGDHKAYPVYMTIGNITATARMKVSLPSVVLLALLPISMKATGTETAKAEKEKKEKHRLVIQEILQHILKALIRPERRIFHSLCTDGFFRRCVAIPGGWIADYPEHVQLANILSMRCYWCECPAKEMGDLPLRYERHAPRDHNVYHSLNGENTDSARAELAARGVHSGYNVLWELDCVTSDLPKPDILHTMQLGMLKHLMGWLSQFLRSHGRFQLFNAIWLKVPSYLEMSKPKKSWEQVSSWTGKEMKTIFRFVVAVLRGALRDPSSSQKGEFHEAMECARALTEFFFYSRYDLHDDETLNLMDDALQRFHDYKSVFARWRVGKEVSEEGKEMRKECNEKRDDELDQMRRDGASAKQLQNVKDYWKAETNDQIANFLSQNGNYHFPKIHQMIHFREQIQRYGTLRQWSTEHADAAHKDQIKVGYNASNRTGDIYTQILKHYA